MVNLLEYFKIYSFRRQFRHQFSTVYHVILQAPMVFDCPVNYVKFERILQKLLMRLVRNLIEYFKIYLFRRQFNDMIPQSILNRFNVILHTPFGANCPENVVKFDRVFQKLLMWCTETTKMLKIHWNSTEEVPSPHRTCVTEQFDKAGRQDWGRCQHYIDIGPISLFFFFFFF